MREKQILFSTPMVQAILAGNKTMTRRVVKPNPAHEVVDIWTDTQDPPRYHFQSPWAGKPCDGIHVGGTVAKPKYIRGDILWVRETWTKYCRVDESGYTHYDEETTYYAADGEPTFDLYDADGFLLDDQRIKWKPSIFMPRSACRLFLKVTNIRVERLQEITVEDVIAEGIETDNDIRNPDPQTHESIKNWNYQYAQFQYKELWDNLNSKRGYGWDLNPWVWVVEFERI